MEYNTYRLVGIKPKSMQLPLKSTFVKKIVDESGTKVNKGFKRIKFVEGADTIFAEDIKGDLQPQSIWFEDGEVKVRKDDVLKNLLMTRHPWLEFGIYAIWSQDLEDKTELEKQRLKSTARQLIDDADFDKIKAIALAVEGVKAIDWSNEKCELELRKYADQKPKKLKEVMAEKDYQSRLLAGMAFVKGIVKENPAKTAVVWSDSDGLIIKLAKGEKGILELGRFLSTATDESKTVLQSIGDRLEAIVTKTTKADLKQTDLEKENANLKAQLAAFQAKSEKKPKKVKEPKELTEVQQARLDFKEKFNKDVPNNMKNNLLWMQNRLGEE